MLTVYNNIIHSFKLFILVVVRICTQTYNTEIVAFQKIIIHVVLHLLKVTICDE